MAVLLPLKRSPRKSQQAAVTLVGRKSFFPTDALAAIRSTAVNTATLIYTLAAPQGELNESYHPPHLTMCPSLSFQEGNRERVEQDLVRLLSVKRVEQVGVLF